MGTKITSSSGSVLEEPEIQKLQMQAKIFKENSLNKLNALKSTTQLLERQSILFNRQRFQEVQSSVTSSGDETSSGIVSDEEIDKQKLEAHSSYMAKIQEVSPDESSSTLSIEQYKSMMKNVVVDQNAAECVDECAALANLIANLTLDTEENKTILKQLKKANASLTQELKECKTNLDESSRALGRLLACRDILSDALSEPNNELEKTDEKQPSLQRKCFKCISKKREQYHEIQDLKAQMQDKNIAISELKKLIENCKGKSMETQFQTKQSVNKTNVSDGLFKQVTQQNLPQIRKQAVRNTNVIAPGPSRNNPKHVSFQSPKEFVVSNDMVHNYYLEKAKKSAQLQKDKEVNGRPSMIDPARLPNTTNGLHNAKPRRCASIN
ncbi:hypothetical protein Tco_1194872 [Tanacetum coccineum]